MAIKLVRHAGTITVSTMGDDAAHSLDCGLMGKGHWNCGHIIKWIIP